MYDIIIVGSGPAGLSLAANLQQYNQKVLILEKGGKVANSWAEMPDYLKLVSPKKTNSLLKEAFLTGSALDRTKASEYWDYLFHFSFSKKFNVELDSEVHTVVKNNDDFIITTSNKEYKCKNIVWATGYFSNPIIPIAFEGQYTIPILHTRNIKNIGQLVEQKIKNVLVVGKRLSSGQIIEQLESVGINYSISSRSPIKFVSSGVIFNTFMYFLEVIEAVYLRLSKNLKVEVDVKMESASVKKLLKANKLEVFPEVKAISGDQVEFFSGEKKSYDAVILATGFSLSRKALGELGENIDITQLKNNFSHPLHKGLYFLGCSLQVNFRSRFLRGIREDAKELASLILREKNN